EPLRDGTQRPEDQGVGSEMAGTPGRGQARAGGSRRVDRAGDRRRLHRRRTPGVEVVRPAARRRRPRRGDVVKVGSLFAGIGGFDLAAERVGMEVAWQSELDPHASRVLAHHWPDVPNLGDIHDITEPPTVDVLTGGFPCQDYSVAGNRAGLAGDRGALWWQMHRIVAQLRPTWIVGENVPGLLSSRGGADFETIVRSLTELGYGVAWAVLDAQYFGVAQRRRRVFIVGHSGGVPRPEILALSEGLYGHPEPSRETGRRTSPILAARTRSGGEL